MKSTEEYNIILSSLANQEWVNVIDWYNNKKEGLGFEVFDEIDRYLEKLKSAPFIHRKIDEEIRISLTPRFHFAIFYTIVGNTICVIGIRNQRENYSDVFNRL
jgi:hypothetical protein